MITEYMLKGLSSVSVQLFCLCRYLQAYNIKCSKKQRPGLRRDAFAVSVIFEVYVSVPVDGFFKTFVHRVFSLPAESLVSLVCVKLLYEYL